MSKDPIYKALQKWMDLVGIVPDADKVEVLDYCLRECIEDLQQTQELDNTGITTAMLLRSFMRNFTDGIGFTLTELVESPQESHELITKVLDLTQFLQSPKIRDRIRAFQNTLREAVKFYGFDREGVEELIADEYELAFVRRDAKRGFRDLVEHQFLQGEEEVGEAKYNPNVHEVWNVNSMLEICKGADNGISLCLIREPRGETSFFALLSKNGSVITMLTDSPDWEHPHQKYMTRNPGRELGRRMYRNHFPYALLDLVFDRRGDPVAKQRTQLVPYQSETIPLKKIAELEPNEILWLIMMFDQMKEKYWVQRYRTKQLAYTAEMFVEADRILKGVTDLAVRNGYEPIKLSPLSTEDVTVESTADQWRDEPTRANEWMEKRYGDKVPDSVLNVLGKKKPALPLKGMQRETRRELVKGLTSVDPTWFGSKKELVRDRLWVARKNKARTVEALAKDEFVKRKQEVIDWYAGKVKANFQTLLAAMVKKELIVPDQYSHPDMAFDRASVKENNILAFRDLPNEDKDGPARSWISDWHVHLTATLYGRRDGHDWRWKCYICGERWASLFWKLRPTTAEAVAVIAGVGVDELPEVIRHWREHDPYCGNPILQRLDPMDWDIEDPWKKVNFHVGVRTCKICMKRHAKSLGTKFTTDGPANASYYSEEE